MNSHAASEAALSSGATSTNVAAASNTQVTRLWIAGILLLCGGLAAAVAHVWFPVLRPAEELMVPTPPPEIAIAREAALSRCRALNSLMVVGLFAGLAGGGLAGVSAVRRGGQPSVATSAALGALSALLLGGLGVAVGHVIMDYVKVDPTVLMYKTMGAQALLMALLGAGLGLAMGLGYRRPGSIAAFTGKGVVAGILAAIIYLLITGVVFSDSQTDYLIPGGVLAGGKDLPILLTWLGSPIVGLVALLPLAYRDLQKAGTGKQVAVEPTPAE